MSDWWDGDPREQYWCEISDRPDPSADLKCPKTRENSSRDWSYDLILEVQPEDIVFHYSTRVRAFNAASVGGGPVEARDTVWAPHGTSGRAKSQRALGCPSDPTTTTGMRPAFASTSSSRNVVLPLPRPPNTAPWCATSRSVR